MTAWNDADYHANAHVAQPFEPGNVNPASYDLRLGNTLRRSAPDGWCEPETFERTWLQPGEFVLCHSMETVTIPDDCAGMLFSKSSTGRNGLEHLHAGWFDPGFSGQATLEFHNVAPWPIFLEAGKRVMQIVIIRLDAAPLRTYAATGRYQGQQGPTPARGER